MCLGPCFRRRLAPPRRCRAALHVPLSFGPFGRPRRHPRITIYELLENAAYPADPQRAGFHAAQSLGAGFIGLDFEQDEGDLMRAKRKNLPAKPCGY